MAGFRRQSGKTVLFDEALQVPARHEIPPDVIEPDGLAVFAKLQKWIHVTSLVVDVIGVAAAARSRGTWALASSTSRSGVKPYFCCSALSGAEAPKVCIPTMVRSAPT
jgi:hypothetical protein